MSDSSIDGLEEEDRRVNSRLSFNG